MACHTTPYLPPPYPPLPSGLDLHLTSWCLAVFFLPRPVHTHTRLPGVGTRLLPHSFPSRQVLLKKRHDMTRHDTFLWAEKTTPSLPRAKQATSYGCDN